ncbi:MAG: hypothetical protein B7Z26_06100, partial [Asticcacaulis sp. 32-58-5]
MVRVVTAPGSRTSKVVVTPATGGNRPLFRLLISASVLPPLTMDIQNSFQDQGKNVADGSQFANPELWSQFMSVQTPVIQSMMSNYIEQSKNMFVQMQD